MNLKNISFFSENLLTYLNKGHKRSIEARKNIFLSFIIKSVSILINFLIVPITINYVNTTQYGIWLTLSSIVSWFTFFDVGFGNGLRNKFAESKAKGDFYDIKKYVSTTYFAVTCIFTCVWIVFVLCNQFINWSIILNAPQEMEYELRKLSYIVISFFCLQVILKTYSTILIADQRPAISALFDTIAQLLSLTIIYILTFTTEGSLIYLSLAIGFSPLVVYVGTSLFGFRTRYKICKPEIKFIDYKYAKDILNLGSKFFVIQIAAIIQYQTANIIIAQNFSPVDVTAFNIVYKYFGLLGMLFSILITPFWSASTDAFTLGDFAWIKRSVTKYIKVYLVITFLGIIMLVFSDTIYKFWIGKELPKISFELSLLALLYFSTMNFGSIFVSFLNGIGKIRIQFYNSIISPILFVLLGYFLINIIDLPLYFVLVSSIVVNVYGIIIAPYQYFLIINGKAKGIWNL